MLHADNEKVKQLLFSGNFGLEKESLRITPEGYMAHSKHPFSPEHKHIVRDFCENQTEINTPVVHTPQEAVDSLYRYTVEIQKGLAALPERELLWPFSSPPFIINEADVPIARFEGSNAAKTSYREYLSDRYGRYKMTFCGIHVNYSFSDELLKADFELSGESDFDAYRNNLYLVLAERCASYSWILTAVTAASPLLDSSFVEKGRFGENEFNGMASTRCSELGYWNFFTPILDYTGLGAYCDSIKRYVDMGLIAAPSELYYPVRLKPRGVNNLERLRSEGVDHIELRMFDLNPLCPEGIDVRDLKFAQMLLIYLAGSPRQPYAPRDQVQSSQNFKNAAHYDLKTVKIVVPNGEVYTVAHAARNIIGFMREFYKDFPAEVTEILDFEEEKLIDPEKRYSWILRHKYRDGFVKGGLELAEKYQELALNV